jgi:hypothetical protein
MLIQKGCSNASRSHFLFEITARQLTIIELNFQILSKALKIYHGCVTVFPAIMIWSLVLINLKPKNLMEEGCVNYNYRRPLSGQDF